MKISYTKILDFCGLLIVLSSTIIFICTVIFAIKNII